MNTTISHLEESMFWHNRTYLPYLYKDCEKSIGFEEVEINK